MAQDSRARLWVDLGLAAAGAIVLAVSAYSLAAPHLVRVPDRIDVGAVRQGEVIPVDVVVDNWSLSRLALRPLAPGCGAKEEERVYVPPLSSHRFTVMLETSRFPVGQRKEEVVMLGQYRGEPFVRRIPVVFDSRRSKE